MTKTVLSMLVAGVLGALVACSSKTVVVDAAQPDAATPEETDAGESCTAALAGDCGTCMKTSCCTALTDCEGDPDCLACVNGTDSEACEKTEATHQRVDGYLTCKGGACRSSCIVEAGGSCVGLLTDLVDAACQTCMEQSCCDEVAACKGAEVCWDGCFINHDETKCHGAPDAHSLYHALGQCASSKCGSKCQ